MTDQTDKRLANSGDIDQQEKVNEGMQGADGNTDANGLSPDPAKRQEKLEELTENLGNEKES